MTRALVIAISSVALPAALTGPIALPSRIGSFAPQQSQQQASDTAPPPVQAAPDSLGRPAPAQPAAPLPDSSIQRAAQPQTSRAAARTEPSMLLLGGIAAGAVALLALAIFALVRIVRRRRADKGEDSQPIFAFPARNDQPILVDFPVQRPRREEPPPPAYQPVAAPPAVPLPAAPQPAAAPQPHLVGLPPNSDETIQLLPGRLEMASANGHKKEVRFVKGSGPAVVTFGRHAGDPATHVQVDSPTVSRLHASMRYDDGRWRIQNLSATNPVMLNGQLLEENGDEHALNDGDRVEMGDVIFYFWSR